MYRSFSVSKSWKWIKFTFIFIHFVNSELKQAKKMLWTLQEIMKMFLGQFLICNCRFFFSLFRYVYCIFLKLCFEIDMKNGHAFKNISSYFLHQYWDDIHFTYLLSIIFCWFDGYGRWGTTVPPEQL